jgi:CheY-like chemotaxis protein
MRSCCRRQSRIPSMLRTPLTKWGHEATMARDGNETGASSTGRFPACRSRLMMPGMDGVELCCRAARQPRTLHTSRCSPPAATAGPVDMEAGADDYLTNRLTPTTRVRLRAGRASSIPAGTPAAREHSANRPPTMASPASSNAAASRRTGSELADPPARTNRRPYGRPYGFKHQRYLWPPGWRCGSAKPPTA